MELMTNNEKLTAMFEITNLELLTNILTHLEWITQVMVSGLIVGGILGVVYLYKEIRK